MSIIECRNKDALLLNPTQTFGDWQTLLQEKIQLEDGDSIICRNSFIDTKASSDQKIVIPTDINLSVQFYMYMINYRGAVNEEYQNSGQPKEFYYDPTKSWITPKNPGPPVGSYPTPASTRALNDNHKYMVCTAKTVAGDQFHHIATMRFNTVYAFQNCGGFYVWFRFYDIDSLLNVTRVYLAKNDSFEPEKCNFDYDIDIVYNATKTPFAQGQTQNIECYLDEDCTKRFDPPRGTAPGSSVINDDTRAHNIPVGTLVVDDVYSPKVFEKNVVLPAANYSADDLTATMNRLLTEVGPAVSSTDLTDNPFLTELGGGTAQPYNHLIRFTDGKDENIYGYTINEADGFKVWCGASQVELAFDPDSKKFAFTFAHLPLYQDAALAVGYVIPAWTGQNNDTPGALGSVKNYSGILFKGLHATRVDNGANFSFWDKILGFDLSNQIRKPGVAPVPNPNCILTPFTMRTGTVNEANATFPMFNTVFPTEGIQFTQGFQGIDTAIQKGNASASPTATTPFYTPISLTTAGEVFSTSSDTDAIIALNSILAVDDPNLAFGYFLIEVRAQFNNNFITVSENKSDIVAIVSRYYHESNYTSSASDASLVYTHHGEPVLLNAFSCRVLNSDKKLAVNIGLDNTIFLEVVKGIKKPALKK